MAVEPGDREEDVVPDDLGGFQGLHRFEDLGPFGALDGHGGLFGVDGLYAFAKGGDVGEGSFGNGGIGGGGAVGRVGGASTIGFSISVSTGILRGRSGGQATFDAAMGGLEIEGVGEAGAGEFELDAVEVAFALVS